MVAGRRHHVLGLLDSVARAVHLIKNSTFQQQLSCVLCSRRLEQESSCNQVQHVSQLIKLAEVLQSELESCRLAICHAQVCASYLGTERGSVIRGSGSTTPGTHHRRAFVHACMPGIRIIANVGKVKLLWPAGVSELQHAPKGERNTMTCGISRFALSRLCPRIVAHLSLLCYVHVFHLLMSPAAPSLSVSLFQCI